MDIACDDQLTFYADGQALIDDTTPGYGVWDKIHHVDIPVGTRVYGIRCVNAGGPGGIVASFSDGTVTDGRWRYGQEGLKLKSGCMGMRGIHSNCNLTYHCYY